MDSEVSPKRGSTAGATTSPTSTLVPRSARRVPTPRSPPKPAFPEKVTQPTFKNYLYRYGAYPGYRDDGPTPVWPDGAAEELTRRLATPTKSKVGRVGQKDFGFLERAMGDLPYARNPQAKEAHEWVWYNIKDPNQFGLKPPRRWNPAGVQKLPPKPFYNMQDGHFLLNNSCTLVRLFLKPELRRLQCYFFPKLPKLIHPVCYHPPIPHVHRASTMWTRPEMWVPPMIAWNIKSVRDDLEVEELRVTEALQADKENSMRHYSRYRRGIERLRAFHRMPKLAAPPPPKVKIDHKLRVRREELRGVRKVKPQWEDPVLSFWIDDLPDIMEIILAEERARKALEDAKEKKDNPTPPSPTSLCQSCEFFP